MNRKRALPGIALLLALAAGIGWWVWGDGVNAPGPDLAAPTVEETTIFRHEVVYACGDRKTRQHGQPPPELHGLDISGVLDRYPGTEGWSVFFDLPHELVVTQRSGEFCPEHVTYRHLGTCDGYVAIYEGPLGGNGKVLEVLDLRVDSLPESYRQKLLKATAFAEQSAEIQAELRREMEFPDEAALYAALENLDELRQD